MTITVPQLARLPCIIHWACHGLL